MKYGAFIHILVLAVIAPLMSQGNTEVMLELNVDEESKKVEVFADGQLFTAYIYPEQLKKPVLWPLMSPEGNVLTRSFPMENREGDRADHPHHVGIWFNYGDVNGLDFWNNSEARAPEDRHKYGSIQHLSIDKAKGGSGRAELSTRSEWISPGGEVLLNEESTFHFLAGEGLRIIDRITTLEAVADMVLFKDNKEGMFAIRVARELELPSNGSAKLMDAHGYIKEVEHMENTLVKGNYRNSNGIEGDKVWGTRCPWMKLSSEVKGETISLVIIDHPSNPGYPTYWHARSYGLFSANTLGHRVFSEGEHELNFTLNRGDRHTFHYRLVAATGDLSDEEIQDLADAFVAGKD